MKREELEKIEEEEAESIEKFKNTNRILDEDSTLSEYRDSLIEKLEKYYVIIDKKEFKKHNKGTLRKIHQALKDEEPGILAMFGITPKRKK